MLVEIWKLRVKQGDKDEKAFTKVLKAKRVNRLRWLLGEPFEIVQEDLNKYREILPVEQISFPAVVFVNKDGSLFEEAGKSVFVGDDILAPGNYEWLLRRVLEKSCVRGA